MLASNIKKLSHPLISSFMFNIQKSIVNNICQKSPRFIVAISTLIASCTTPAPTYRYSDVSLPNAEISFESDYVLHTHFSINIVDAERNACKDYKTVGYLLYEDSIFLYDKANKIIKIKVPANKEIAISGISHIEAYWDPVSPQMY